MDPLQKSFKFVSIILILVKSWNNHKSFQIEQIDMLVTQNELYLFIDSYLSPIVS